MGERLVEAPAVVDAVVATSTDVDDETAIDFSGTFYSELAFGADIRGAFDAATAAIAAARENTRQRYHLLVPASGAVST